MNPFIDAIKNVPGYEESSSRMEPDAQSWRWAICHHETQDSHSGCPFPRLAPGSARVHVQVKKKIKIYKSFLRLRYKMVFRDTHSDWLLSLSFVLHRCNPWFIRCLKPNRQRGETSHELGFARRPITLACWRRFALIRKNGYPVRMTFQRCLLTRRERRNLARSPNPPGLTIGRIQIGSDARGSR